MSSATTTVAASLSATAAPTNYPPFFEITDDNCGPYAVVIAFCSIALMTCVAVIRILLAGRQRVDFGFDDTSFAVAVVFAISNALCYYRAAVVGLGRHIDGVGSDHLVSYYKWMYAAQIFSIISQGVAKISVVMLFSRLALDRNREQFIFVASITLWAFISIFLTAFQCQLPHPWIFIPSKCTTHGRVQYPIIIFNIITDVALSLGILPIVRVLSSTHNMRFTVASLFMSRLIVVCFSIGLLVTVAQSVNNVDQTWVNLPRVLWDLAVIFLSVITATIPRTNTFWNSLQSGKAAANVTEQELSNTSFYGSERGKGKKRAKIDPNSRASSGSGSQSHNSSGSQSYNSSGAQSHNSSGAQSHNSSDESSVRRPDAHRQLRSIPNRLIETAEVKRRNCLQTKH